MSAAFRRSRSRPRIARRALRADSLRRHTTMRSKRRLLPIWYSKCHLFVRVNTVWEKAFVPSPSLLIEMAEKKRHPTGILLRAVSLSKQKRYVLKLASHFFSVQSIFGGKTVFSRPSRAKACLPKLRIRLDELFFCSREAPSNLIRQPATILVRDGSARCLGSRGG